MRRNMQEIVNDWEGLATWRSYKRWILIPGLRW
jgi:hypothetical protein